MSLEAELEKITELTDSVVSRLGVVLVDLRIRQLGKRRSLEVTIYRSGGRITLEDCESVSRALEDELDRQAPPVVKGAYVLEVQSPGIERQLKTDREFRVFAGQTVSVTARESIEPVGPSFLGTLLGASQGTLVIGYPKPLPSDSSRQSKGSKRRSAASAQEVNETPPGKLEVDMNKLLRVKLYPDQSSASKGPFQET